MAPALKVLNIAVESTVTLYIRYWPNLVINTFAAFILIIILYYLLKLYQEISLKVVKYIKGKINLSETTPISTC